MYRYGRRRKEKTVAMAIQNKNRVVLAASASAEAEPSRAAALSLCRRRRIINYELENEDGSILKYDNSSAFGWKKKRKKNLPPNGTSKNEYDRSGGPEPSRLGLPRPPSPTRGPPVKSDKVTTDSAKERFPIGGSRLGRKEGLVRLIKFLTLRYYVGDR